MSILFTNYKQLLVAIFVMVISLSSLAGCGSDSTAIGIEPSLGTPQTLYRDSSPVVTAELDVLGTVQVHNELETDSELAIEPVSDSSGLPLIWFGVVGLGLAAVAITLLAVVREEA